MKKSTLLSTLIVASATISSLQAATSDVVGYVTLTVSGTGGAGSEAISVLGSPLESAAVAQGALDSVSANTLADLEASFDSYASGTHYVQITSGVNAGTIATVSSSTATELTTVEDLSGVLVGDESYSVRPYTTLSDVFGAANEAGLTGGSASANADEVLLFNGSGFDVYYYQQGAAFGGEGWRVSGNAFTDQAGVAVPPGLAVIVKRKSSDDLSVVVSGSVFPSDTVVPVENGVNWIASAHPVELTLAGYFGADGGNLQKGASISNADEILVPNSSGGFDVYYFQEGAAFGGDGFRLAGNAFTSQDDTVLATVGSGFVLKRAGSAYNQLDVSPLN